jgi:hypothetical protein
MLVKVLETSPPNISFKRDVIVPKQASWHVLLHRLAFVH